MAKLVRRRNRRSRRSNPTRATGMILVNPFRSNPKKKKRAASKAKAVRKTRRARKARKSKYGAGGRWSSAKYRAMHNPRRRRNRRSKVRVSNRRRRNVRSALRRNTRRIYNRRRRNVLVLRSNKSSRRRRNRRVRRNGVHRRRNSGMTSLFNKIPVVGPVLSSMFGFAIPAVFGAVSVEPVMWVAKALAPFVPQVPASLFYPLVGVLVAALVRFVPGLSPETKRSLALAVASAAGGVGYYKARTGADAEMATEAGLLELRGVGGFGSILQIRNGLSGYGYAYNPHQIRNAYSDGGAYTVQAGANGVGPF